MANQTQHAICGGKTCKQCLTHKTCVWMRDGHCADDCVNFPDINCYFPEIFGSWSTNRHEICEVEKELHADNERCFVQKSAFACHEHIGCVWLGGVMPSGKREHWCALHLESTNTTKANRVHHTYPPFDATKHMGDSPAQVVHNASSNVILDVLLVYALLPFVWWALWLLVVWVRRIRARWAAKAAMDASSPFANMNVV